MFCPKKKKIVAGPGRSRPGWRDEQGLMGGMHAPRVARPAGSGRSGAIDRAVSAMKHVVFAVRISMGMSSSSTATARAQSDLEWNPVIALSPRTKDDNDVCLPSFWVSCVLARC